MGSIIKQVAQIRVESRRKNASNVPYSEFLGSQLQAMCLVTRFGNEQSMNL